MPHRFLAIIIRFYTRLAASAQTSNPSNSSEWPGAVFVGEEDIVNYRTKIPGLKVLASCGLVEKNRNVED